MDSSSTPRGLSARDSRRLEFAAQAVIDSARQSGNSTGRNWRRLPTTPINEHYLTEYSGLTNQEIALRETMEEVERRVIEHELDLDLIDNIGLQGTIEDVLNDILDFMVIDARASSSDESDSNSSGSEGSDESNSDYPKVSRSDSTSRNSASDAMHVRQAHERPHHEAGHVNTSNSSRVSSFREHVQVRSHTRDAIVGEPQPPQNGVGDDATGAQDREIGRAHV